MKLYKKNNPSVSIILPTYNRRDLLHRSINSVIHQSFTDWELLVVDDGSSDDTYDVVSSFMKDFEKIRYLKHTNRKLPLTLNAGIQASAGSLLTFLGSDDEFKKDHIKLRFDYLKKNPVDRHGSWRGGNSWGSVCKGCKR